ncbi:microfibril-associated glycoprotein 4-like [Hyalella azteca]|uniref:Microfibril-associated glycoprotein 4-like n=1 Tax=Hyalella azteca TaxID=294128 RepID=A0A8B7PFU8_HYAAZ|nr:microfibril-associated glycoprotein 4-like [Hyalella azteca]
MYLQRDRLAFLNILLSTVMSRHILWSTVLILAKADGQTAAQQRSPSIGAVNQCLASVVTALDVIGNPRSEGDISVDKFTPQQQRTYEELQELADVLRTETSGTEKKKSSVVNVVEDLMAYRRCIVEGGESAPPRVDATPAMAPFTPAHCSERPEKTSGVYTIYPSGAAVQVYCDQTTDGGGWTVFLRRQKQEPQLNFSRTFKEYEEGFGSPSGEYWLGLENLHLLTTTKTHEMLAVIVRGVNRTSSRYLDFKVEGGKNYTLRVGGYDNVSSSAGDPLTNHDGMQFSTIDRDRFPGAVSCSEKYGGGGWWYHFCYDANPTGVYGGDKPAEVTGGKFLAWNVVNQTQVTQLALMVRPKD